MQGAREQVAVLPTRALMCDVHALCRERAQLKPGVSPAVTATLGGVPASHAWSRAWRGAKPRGGRGGGKAPEAEAGAEGKAEGRQARLAFPSAGASAASPSAQEQPGTQQPQQQARSHKAQAQLAPEQERFRERLSAWLGRRVPASPLARGAPPLDVKGLWQAVMDRGGSGAVAAAPGGWEDVALVVQRSEALVQQVQQVCAHIT